MWVLVKVKFQPGRPFLKFVLFYFLEFNFKLLSCDIEYLAKSLYSGGSERRDSMLAS